MRRPTWPAKTAAARPQHIMQRTRHGGGNRRGLFHLLKNSLPPALQFITEWEMVESLSGPSCHVVRISCHVVVS
jgi:hypothetical protein